jgi:hypothetical protein
MQRHQLALKRARGEGCGRCVQVGWLGPPREGRACTRETGWCECECVSCDFYTCNPASSKTLGGARTHTRQTHTNLTNQPQNQQLPHGVAMQNCKLYTHLEPSPTDSRARAQTTPTPAPRNARVASNYTHTPLTLSSAVVVTEMATAPRRGSSEGASPTASCPTAIGDGTPPRVLGTFVDRGVWSRPLIRWCGALGEPRRN